MMCPASRVPRYPYLPTFSGLSGIGETTAMIASSQGSTLPFSPQGIVSTSISALHGLFMVPVSDRIPRR
jgi:hypothetical protein